MARDVASTSYDIENTQREPFWNVSNQANIVQGGDEDENLSKNCIGSAHLGIDSRAKYRQYLRSFRRRHVPHFRVPSE